MKAKGKGLIKLASVFLLIAGIVNMALMTAILLNGGYEEIFGDKINIMAGLSALGAYVIGLLQVVGAVIGFMNGNKPDKFGTITVMGLVLIIATIAWFIPELITEKQAINWYVYGFSVLIPVLYYVGGKQNKIAK